MGWSIPRSLLAAGAAASSVHELPNLNIAADFLICILYYAHRMTDVTLKMMTDGRDHRKPDETGVPGTFCTSWFFATKHIQIYTSTC
jgi:hypothetical protein